MKMLTAPIIRQLKKTGNTDGTEVSPVIVKFFQPWGSWTWYAVDGVELPDGDWEFFGLVEGLETELGYFRLSELMSVTGPGGLKIERDLHFHGYVLDKNTNVVRRADDEMSLMHATEVSSAEVSRALRDRDREND